MFLTCLLSVCFSLCLVASLTVCLRRKRGARDALLRLLDPELAHPDRQHLVDRAVQTATDDVLHSFFCTPSGQRLHRSVACCHVVDRVVSEVQVPACVATLLYDSRNEASRAPRLRRTQTVSDAARQKEKQADTDTM